MTMRWTPLISLATLAAILMGAALGHGQQGQAGEEPLERVAVIPFRNESGAAETAAIGITLGESITNSLNELGGMSVLGQNIIWKEIRSGAVGQPRRNLAEALALAKKLRLNSIVTGSYKLTGSTLNVECTLVDVNSGQSDPDKVSQMEINYPKDSGDLVEKFPAQFAKVLRPAAASTVHPRPGPTPTVSPEAQQFYAAGLQNASQCTQAGFTEAKASFQLALKKDPNFDLALEAKTNSEIQLTRLKQKKGQDASGELSEAVADALNAVKLSPYSGAAHWNLSRVLTLEGDYDDAAVAARVAQQLWPASGEVVLDLVRATGQGQIVDGPELQRAIRMAPAVTLVADEMPKVTVMNSSSAALEVKFENGSQTFAVVTVPAGATTIVPLIAGKYTVTSSGGETSKKQEIEFKSDTVYAVEGRSLVATVGVDSTPRNEKQDLPDADPGQLRKPRIQKNIKANFEMVYVWNGPFKMGDEGQADNPPHNVTLSAYWIGRTLVSVKEFKAFTQAPDGYNEIFPKPFDWDKYKPSYDWHDENPMVNVTWEEAREYCRWAGGDLPTEAQWEHAARGFGKLSYPWGKEFIPKNLQFSAEKPLSAGGPAPVIAHPDGVSPYGCLDMAGNVFQWCRDGYEADISKKQTDPIGSGPTMVIRGGSWAEHLPADFLSAKRTHLDPKTKRTIDPHDRSITIGFRFVGPPDLRT